MGARRGECAAAAFALLGWMAGSAACAPGFRTARLSVDDAPTQREIEDATRLHHSDCAPRLSLLFPGSVALCEGRTREGTALAALGATELTAGLAFGIKDGFDSTQALLPFFVFGDLLAADSLDANLRRQRSLRLTYVPPETLPELAAAPFSGEILREPAVWAGIAGTVGLGLVYSRLVDGPYDATNFGKRPVLFGRTVQTLPGSALAGAVGVGVFEHVSVAEEMIFRGYLQSGLTRRYGEDEGWLLGSLIFGAFHATNILFIAPGQRLHYLYADVPFITVVGSYLGYVYRRDRFSLSAPVAIHFWYDFLTEAVSFALDPKNSPLAVSFGSAF